MIFSKDSFLFIYFIFLISYQSLNVFCADYVITTSGTYILNDDLLSTNADSNGAIRISSSFVTLDLNGRFVYQNNATAGANGIVVDAGLTDVIIKNGTIVNFRRSGILVNAGCSVIKLQDLMIENCAIRGIELIGTAANKIIKSEVNNCKIFNCCTSATSSDSALMLTQCTDVLVNYCRISDISSVNINILVNLNTCVSCELKYVFLDNNSRSGGALSGIFFSGSNNCRFYNVIVRNQRTPSGNNTLFDLSSSINKFNSFYNCMLLNSSGATNQSATGFSIGSSSDSFLKKCICSGLSAGQIGGFVNSSSPAFLELDECVSIGNTGINLNGGANAGYFFFNSTGGSIINKCIGCYNSSSQTFNVACGIILQSTGNSNVYVVNSDFMGNTNSASDAVSHGIRVDGGSNNVFVANVAARNGSTANPNNIGVVGTFPVGSYNTTGGSTTMNSPTAPWTNLSIAS